MRPVRRKYISVALWPKDSGVKDSYGEPKSTDKHYTALDAKMICRALEAEGLGGEGKIFPIRTYVEQR